MSEPYVGRRVEVAGGVMVAWDEADGMCPNCLTPWKCNGPHLSAETPAGRRSGQVQAVIERQADRRAMARAIAAPLHEAKHLAMSKYLRETGIVPELLPCDECGEPLAPWPEPQP